MKAHLIERIRDLCDRGTAPQAVRVGIRSWILTSRGSDLFIKRYDNDRGLTREVATLELLRGSDVPFRHPRVMGTGRLRHSTGTFLVTDVIGRCSLETFARNHAQKRRATLATVGRLLRSFHRIPTVEPADGEASLAAILRACETHARIATERGETTASSLALVTRRWIETHGVGNGPAVLCHGDLHPENIVLANEYSPLNTEAVGLVDFESSRRAPALVDVAKSSVVCGLGDDADTAALVSGYGRTDLDSAVLLGLQAFHTMSGWIYARLIAQRDIALWDYRLRAFGSRILRAR
jgi:aminoglycoside phosphotransferase (APT) family kinase protein